MKKGFTLVEMLAVIVILAAIMLITIPVVTNIIGSSKNTIYQKNINAILNASYDWALENPELLPENVNDSIFITLGLLKYDGYVDSDIKDITSDSEFPNELVIEIKNVKGKNPNKNNYSKRGGDYLFTLKLNELKSDDYLLKTPLLVFTGVDYTDGVYKVDVDYGEEFIYPEYVVTVNSNSENFDYDVTINIVKNGVKTDRLDTSKMGLYYLYYTAIDKLGYASTTILNVDVKDMTAPTLELSGNDVISTSVSSYDLMDGVSCTDNSGECTINVSGSITFGVSDSYVITYTASDPSGNTTSKNRTIRVE